MNTSVNLVANPRRLVPVITMTLLALGTFAALPNNEHKLASANTGFAFELLKQLVKDQPGDNIFISPFGISTMLQMAGNGAGGRTKAEMQQVLGTTGLPQSTLNEANRDIHRALNRTDTNNILTIAQQMYINKLLKAKE